MFKACGDIFKAPAHLGVCCSTTIDKIKSWACFDFDEENWESVLKDDVDHSEVDGPSEAWGFVLGEDLVALHGREELENLAKK